MAYLGDNGLSKLWVRIKAYINNRIANLEQGITMELLWENASPTSSFAAQTISLDLSEYDDFAIDFIFSGTYSNGITRVFFQKNVQKAACIGFVSNAVRIVKVENTGVWFNGGEYFGTYNNASTIQENLCMIPQRIYGIKGVK